MLQSTNSPCQPERGACLEFEIARKKWGQAENAGGRSCALITGLSI
jgi:hypothetical protein